MSCRISRNELSGIYLPDGTGISACSYDDHSMLYTVLTVLGHCGTCAGDLSQIAMLYEKKFLCLCSRHYFYSFRLRLMICNLSLQQKQ